MKKITLSITVIALLLNFLAFGQKNLNFENAERCGSTEYNEKQMLRNPNMMGSKAFEKQLARNIKQARQQQRNKKLVVVTIPVVVHVFNNGETIGAGANISDAQVLSQIQVLNEDFRRILGTRGYNTNAVGADIEVEFCMAQTAPGGGVTNGINRVNIGQDGITGTGATDGLITDNIVNQVEQLKVSSIWDSSLYMNMWSVKFNNSSLLGYAQFPGGDANTDGVVSRHTAFGSNDAAGVNISGIFNLGRTMTHEVGHYLGLLHTFQGGCNPATGGDFCADTPAVANNTTNSSNCNTGNDSCSSDPGQDMVENYMDYSEDACMNIFTIDQKARIQAVITGDRASLTTSKVCNAPTTIDFSLGSVSPGQVQEGSDCSFTDFNIDLTIAVAPSENATVTLLSSGTAVENEDFILLTNNVTFLKGSDTPSNPVTLRVLHDSFKENDETILLSLDVTTTGDANAGTSNYALTIINDDVELTEIMPFAIFNDNFSDGNLDGWTAIDADGVVENDWTLLGDPNNFNIYTDFFLASFSWNGVAYTPDNYISSPKISIPAVGNTNLKYFVGSGDAPGFFNENYEIYVSSTIGSVANITSGTKIKDAVLTELGGKYEDDNDLSAFAGQDVYITFRHHDTNGEFVLGIDDVTVSNEATVMVQTDINTASAGNINLNGSGKAFIIDNNSNNIVLSLDNTGGFDFGCTSAWVSRDAATAGAGGVAYTGTNGVAGFVTAKTFNITTTNSSTTNANTIDFYFTEAEIAAWESISGESRSALNAFNEDTGETVAVVITTFAEELKLSANFTKGLSGKYLFGTLKILSNPEFALESSISLYPNPTLNVLNIKVSDKKDTPNSYKIYNILGQLISENKINTPDDLMINTTAYSNGLYFIKIAKDNSAVTLPFIKK